MHTNMYNILGDRSGIDALKSFTFVGTLETIYFVYFILQLKCIMCIYSYVWYSIIWGISVEVSRKFTGDLMLPQYRAREVERDRSRNSLIQV